jgi:hypothetical protein
VRGKGGAIGHPRTEDAASIKEENPQPHAFQGPAAEFFDNPVQADQPAGTGADDGSGSFIHDTISHLFQNMEKLFV